MADEKKKEELTFHTDSTEQDPKIPDRQPDVCPHCSAGPESFEMGFGLAGGGYGAYTYCGQCGNIIHKSQEPLE